jgi:ribosomal protein S18 acetylase RimI-like enzyme
MINREDAGENSSVDTYHEGGEKKKDSRRQRGTNKRRRTSGGIEIREIREEDAQAASDLIVRLKRLNGEFDPLFKTPPSLEADALKILRQAMDNKDYVVLVAVQGKDKVVGIVNADLEERKDRVYYEPKKKGSIVEFYILPEFRRGSLGKDLFYAMVDALKKKGAVLITAEFPSQNEIAKRFYTKLGLRPFTEVYAKLY